MAVQEAASGGYVPVLLGTVQTQGKRWSLMQRTSNKNKKDIQKVAMEREA